MLVPKLRFKEFNNEWKSAKLGKYFDITSSKRVFQSEWTTNGIPFYRAREIVKLVNNGYVDNELFISKSMYDEYSKKYGKIQKNDLLITGVGTIGICYLVKETDEFYFKDGNLIWLKPKNKYINSKFVKYLFQSSYIINQVNNFGNGTTVATYTIDNANETNINFPSLEEQTKIANFLSLIDRKIELQEKLVENLKLYKKGLLKKVFSNNQGWKSAKLNDISSILSGKRIPKGMDTVSYNTGIPYITVSNMGDFFVNENNIKYITNDVEKQILKYKVKTNDIIISVAGTLGKINIIQKNLCNANLTENCDKITNISKNINYLYLYYYLVVFINEYINSISTKSSQPKLALDKIRTFEIKYPSIEEQNRIANLFTSLDKKIELETKKLQDLKTYKKGLLQKMFI